VGRARAQSSDGGQPLPEGRGKAEFERICSQCHAVNVATKLKMDEDGWTGVVNDMVSRGAQGTDDEFDRVVKYLTAHFGPNSSGGDAKQSTTAGISSADAQAIVHYRQSSGDFKDWHDLEKVPNIDMKKLAAQKDRIEFSKAEK
jgi:mono/diheme cytochrome c family protein